MNSTQLFSMALGIISPWEVKNIQFKNIDLSKELHIEIGFKPKSKFLDNKGKKCSVYDTKEKKWQHLNFFEHKCYLSCKVPRIKTSENNIQMIDVPWARKGSGFTLLFEAFTMSLIEGEMPLTRVGKILNINSHRVWTIFNYWIKKAYDSDNPKTITNLGIDETSSKRGHKYITIAVDLNERRIFHVTKGKDKNAVKQVKNYLKSKNISSKQVKHASIDLSPSFIAGIKDNFANAEIHFDRFHVVKLLNTAMNEVRKTERKEHEELKGHKYTVLKNKDNLSEKKRSELNELITLFPNLGKAYRLKELFNDLWDMETKEEAELFLEQWCKEVDREKIPSFMKFVNTVKSHKSGIINFVKTRINNGILEGLNSKIQLAKCRARGFRCIDNFINMIYFLCGKLKFDYPLVSS